MTASEDEPHGVAGVSPDASTGPRDEDEESDAAHRNGDRAGVTDDPDTDEAAEERSSRRADKPAKPVKKGSFWKEVPILIVIALVLTFLIQTFMVRWLRQFGSSIGIGAPPEYDLVKRIIAVGGQTIECCNAQRQTLVDGKPLREPYVYILPGTQSSAYKPFGPITIPQGDLWVEGDSRGNSDDSRVQNGGGLRGVVPDSDVIGIARTIIWPPSRWRGIGETNPQTTAIASAPAWEQGAPLGVGVAAAFPVLWLGKRTRRGLRAGYAVVRDRVRR
ncbi:MAG TPA: signal peptidase I [Pseudonocardiaceae bacterium]|nr:signal peptidase I [Pseudonocardiaceae bacterium]